MASTIATVSPSSMLIFGGNRPFLGNLQRLPVLPISGRRQSVAIVVKAVTDGSNSSESESIVKYVSNAWSTPEDRIALAGLGFAAIVALWASTNLIGAIDKIPFVPGVLEFIGILFSWWFVYRYLLFKPDREELLRSAKKSISDVLGQ
ncbi:hypothetical protein QJS04_geneDACA019425 [Acorus gramineus]|uniref:Cyanobacterial aminoacyl-tRNA synthetase CAAD domain-containing protein n=1 Tax=Acorus gramineus TaxID=55184 RepID=A0AAV9AK94_ACOGR|nr:hypothetical protein QJS04_geneDACA019425 [Acorus gramineus]